VALLFDHFELLFILDFLDNSLGAFLYLRDAALIIIEAVDVLLGMRRAAAPTPARDHHLLHRLEESLLLSLCSIILLRLLSLRLLRSGLGLVTFLFLFHEGLFLGLSP
jgi:hypothetical protein